MNKTWLKSYMSLVVVTQKFNANQKNKSMQLIITFIAVCSYIAWITLTHVWVNSICTTSMCARVWFTVIYIFNVSSAIVDCTMNKLIQLACASCFENKLINLACTFSTICSTITCITCACVWINTICTNSMCARVWITVIYIFNVSCAIYSRLYTKQMNNACYYFQHNLFHYNLNHMHMCIN